MCTPWIRVSSLRCSAGVRVDALGLLAALVALGPVFGLVRPAIPAIGTHDARAAACTLLLVTSLVTYTGRQGPPPPVPQCRPPRHPSAALRSGHRWFYVYRMKVCRGCRLGLFGLNKSARQAQRVDIRLALAL